LDGVCDVGDGARVECCGAAGQRRQPAAFEGGRECFEEVCYFAGEGTCGANGAWVLFDTLGSDFERDIM